MSRITFYGHSCILVDTGSLRIIVDPFISPNPKATQINVNEINGDLIFLTHAHQDHIADVELIAGNNPSCTVITNYELANYFTSKSLTTVGMNHGGIWSTEDLRARFVPAMHSSSLPDGTYGGNPGGWVFHLTDGKIIYCAGDTCLTQDMKLIPLLDGPVDVAILPIGGLFTMHAAEAVQAAKFVQARTVIGCHYDTFPPIEINHDDAISTFAAEDIKLHLLEIGSAIDL